MFTRLRTLIESHRQKCKEASEFKTREKLITEKLQFLGKEWKLFESYALFEDATLVSLCHSVLTLLFWCWLTSTWRAVAILIDGSLVAFAISSDLKQLAWKQAQKYFNFQVEKSRLDFNFADVCHFVTCCWLTAEEIITYIHYLKSNVPHKFALFVGLYVVALLFIIGYLPLKEVLYCLGSLLLFYPSLKHHGILQKAYSKMEQLFHPMITQWNHTQTRRRRDINCPTVQIPFDVHRLSDSEDEFLPDQNPVISDILSSAAVNDESTELSDSMEFYHGNAGVSFESRGSVEDWHGDNGRLTPELTSMPTLSHYDSLMETYDEFHGGLSFPDHNTSIIQHRQEPRNELDNEYTDDEAEAIPYDEDESIHYDETEAMPHNQHYPVTSEEQFSTAQKEENDFEFLERSELEDMDEMVNDVNLTDTRQTEQLNEAQSKWLGY